MSAIETIPVPTYQPLDPYHHIYDNLPINGLIDQILLVNTQVDLNTDDLLNAVGTQGSLGNRLAQSINDDGTLKTTAIDNALHSIAEHLDGDGYVRMTLDERSKLSFIAANATSLSINVETISGSLAFADTILYVEPSDSITWIYAEGKLSAETNFPASVRHTHYYGVTPVTTDYQNYQTSIVNTPYREGSLRVYINGVRLNSASTVYVPFDHPIVTWTALKFTEGTATSGVVTAGDFSLSATISSSANLVIDFDFLVS